MPDRLLCINTLVLIHGISYEIQSTKRRKEKKKKRIKE